MCGDAAAKWTGGRVGGPGVAGWTSRWDLGWMWTCDIYKGYSLWDRKEVVGERRRMKSRMGLFFWTSFLHSFMVAHRIMTT